MLGLNWGQIPINLLFDTNILIDYLNGIEAAKTELDRYADQAISLITWMEVMVGATPETEVGHSAGEQTHSCHAQHEGFFA